MIASMTVNNSFKFGQTTSVLLAATLVYFICSLLFSAEGLPDYASYATIYREVDMPKYDDFPSRAFIALNKFGRDIGLSYEQFRLLVSALSLALLAAALIKADLYIGESGSVFAADSRVRLFPVFLATPAYLIFLLEFFSVRIRAGLSLALVSLAFSVFLTARKRTNIWILAVVAGLIASGYGFHHFTAVALAYFLFSPFLYRKIFRSLLPGKFPEAAVGILLLIISFLFLQQALAGVSARGAHLESPLNTVRLVFISVIPAALIIAGFLPRFMRKTSANNGGAMILNSPATPFSDSLSWINFSKLCYFGLAVTLFLFESTQFGKGAGEAIVRIFTLSSVVAIFALVVGTARHSKFWIFLLLVNSAFFVNTLFTPYGGLIPFVLG